MAISAPHTLSTRHRVPWTGSPGRCYGQTQLHKHTLGALSAAQPHRCTRKSAFPSLYPLPQACAEERPNPVWKQCNSDVTSVRFMNHAGISHGTWDENQAFRVTAHIPRHKNHSHKPSKVFTNIKIGTYNSFQEGHIFKALHMYRLLLESVCVLLPFPHAFSHLHCIFTATHQRLSEGPSPQKHANLLDTCLPHTVLHCTPDSHRAALKVLFAPCYLLSAFQTALTNLVCISSVLLVHA